MKKVDNSWRVADFARNAPGLDWQAFMQAAGLEKQAEWIIWHPGALKHSAGLVASVPLDSWQDYLRFHAIHHRMMVLPQALFDLYFPLEKALSGVSQPESRENMRSLRPMMRWVKRSANCMWQNISHRRLNRKSARWWMICCRHLPDVLSV
jgi:predicted metalloendopeptidase